MAATRLRAVRRGGLVVAHCIWLRGLARCTSMNVVADGKRVLMATGMHVAVSGMTGQPVVVLLHCMGRSGTMWDRHRALLAERFRVLAPDLPGHGKSAGPFTVTGAVTAVADALSRSCGDEPAHLVGLSLGARVGLKLAAERNAASLALLSRSRHQMITRENAMRKSADLHAAKAGLGVPGVNTG